MKWVSTSGVTCVGIVPETTAAVVELQVRCLAPLRMEQDAGQRASPATLGALTRWCARHTAAASCDGRSAHGAALESALDAWLSDTELVAYAVTLMSGAGLPDALLEACGAYLDILAFGGCDCRWCKPRKSVPPPATRPRNCLLGDMPEPALDAVAAWWPLRHQASPSHPYWSHQFARLWSSAQSKRHAEEQRESSKSDYTQGLLKSKGYL